MGRRSKYPEEFRREAVALHRSSDRSRAAVASRWGSGTGRSSRSHEAFRTGAPNAPDDRDGVTSDGAGAC
jgi:transposase-like protein